MPRNIRPAIDNDVARNMHSIIKSTNIVSNYIDQNRLKSFDQGVEDIIPKARRSMKSFIYEPIETKIIWNSDREIKNTIDYDYLPEPNARCSATDQLLCQIDMDGKKYITDFFRQVVIFRRIANAKKIKCGKSVIYDVSFNDDDYYMTIAKNIYNDLNKAINSIRDGNYQEYYKFPDNFYEQFLLPNYFFALEYLDWMYFWVYNNYPQNDLTNYGVILALIELIKPWGTLKNQRPIFDKDDYEKIYNMMVKIYTDKNIDDIRKRHHNMKLMYACNWGDTKLLTQVLDIGIADINVWMGGQSPMYIALERENGNNLNIIKILLDRGANINFVTIYQWNTLHTALSNGLAEEAKLLIRAGINIHQKDKYDNTVLHKIDDKKLKLSEIEELIGMLVSAGLNINEQNEDGDTAMFLMNIETMKIFIKYGADVNAKNYNGWTVLHNLVIAERVEDEPLEPIKNMIEFLLQNGVDPTIRDKENKTALQLAIENDYDAQIIEMLQNYPNNEVDAMKSIIERIYQGKDLTGLTIKTSAGREITISKTNTENVLEILIHEKISEAEKTLFSGEKIKSFEKDEKTTEEDAEESD